MPRTTLEQGEFWASGSLSVFGVSLVSLRGLCVPGLLAVGESAGLYIPGAADKRIGPPALFPPHSLGGSPTPEPWE